MKSYFILDCDKQQKIADSLYGYYVGITANNKPKEFWNFKGKISVYAITQG